MSKTTKKVLVGTPKGVFAYVWADKPDTFKGQEKYKATLNIPKDATNLDWIIGKERFTGTAKQFFDAIMKIHKDFGGSVKAKTPIKDGDKLTDKEDKPRQDTAGFYVLQARSKYKPTKVDAKGNEIPSVPIMGGDVGRLVVILNPYDDGASVQLSKLKLLEKNSTGGSGDPFGEEEGYEGSASDRKAKDADQEDDDADADGDGDDGDDDF